jgi:antitoxin ParD1/3/4
MTIEQAIVEKLRILPPEKQQEVLAFVEFLQTDEWEKVYQGRFKELQQEIQIGIEAAERGEVVDAEEVFQRLREKLSTAKADPIWDLGSEPINLGIADAAENHDAYLYSSD